MANTRLIEEEALYRIVPDVKAVVPETGWKRNLRDGSAHRYSREKSPDDPTGILG